ncbi:uncharacterized protein LOC143177829 isoform X5 [Calliopsis andreniformis]|uniref:uncharacterized protein LOC143177829 isoform X5 n=1 Tax=Calliopsis andreniformis TaxID=337506 RepID=UPI003FCC8399
MYILSQELGNSSDQDGLDETKKKNEKEPEVSDCPVTAELRTLHAGIGSASPRRENRGVIVLVKMPLFSLLDPLR